MKMNGSEILANVLIEQEATTVFGYPGGAVLPIYDALYKYKDQIHHHITAHEQGAAHAADGFARASGKTGVVIATSGPGATNLITGIATAYMDSIPLVAITGNVSSELIGKDSFQEVYTVGMTMPITKHNFMIQKIEDLAPALRAAFRIANSGRKGPVLVDITKDVQAAMFDFVPGEKFIEEKCLTCHDESIWKIVDYIKKSSRPLICFGGGVVGSGASDKMYEFIHKTGIPAVHSIMSTGVLSHNDPLNIGLAGMHGKYSSNKALDSADLIITVGFRFSDRVALNTKKFAQNAKIVQIDIDPSEINKNIKIDHYVVGDILLVLQKLLPLLDAGDYQQFQSKWHNEIAEFKKSDIVPEETPDMLHPHQIIETISRIVGKDAVIVTDVGQHQMWAAQYSDRTNPRSFLTSGGLGTMGFGYGAAIGAKLAVGDRPVIHITGDGSFHMNMNEACTAVSYNLPVISVILNNHVLGMVRQWQTSFYESRYSSTTLNRKTNFTKVAEGFGANGFYSKTVQELEASLKEALGKSNPSWIECPIDMDEKVLPMIPSGKTVDDIMLS